MTTTTSTRRAAHTPATHRDTARLVGRGRLLERIERELGQDRPVNLRGGAGVGKSRVLRELADRHLGPVHLVAGCSEGGATPCARDVPEGDQPLLVLVDDAELLPRLEIARIHALQAQPWCRVVTTVAAHAGPDARLGTWWEAGPWHRLEVTPLDRRATAELLEQLLGGLAEPRLVHEVWRITGGNPVAIKELLRDAQETGCVGPGADSWRLVAPLPLRRLSAWIEPRLEGLSDAGRRDLRILSVASPLPIRAAASLVDARAAQELEARGLVRSQASSRGRTLAIIDPVHAEVVRASMHPEQRREILQALAGTFDRLGLTGRRRLELAQWRLEIGGWSSDEFSAASVAAHGSGDPVLAGGLAEAALASADDATARRVAALSTVERCAGSPIDPTTGRSPCGDDGASVFGRTEADDLVAAQARAVGMGRWSPAAADLLAGGGAGEPGQPSGARRAYAALLQALGGDVTAAGGLLREAEELALVDDGVALTDGSVPPTEGVVADATTQILAAVAHALVGLHAGDGERVTDAVEAAAPLLPQQAVEGVLSTAEHLLAGTQLLADAHRPLRERIAEASDEVDGSLRSFGAETGWWYAVEGWLRWEAGDLAAARDRLVAAMLACRTADPIRLRALVLADLAVLAGLSGSAVEAEWRLGQVGTDRAHNLAVAHRCELAEVLVRCARRGVHGVGPELLCLAERALLDGRERDAVGVWHLVARLGCAAEHAQQAAAGLAALQGRGRSHAVDGAAAHVAAWAADDAAGLEEAARILAATGRTLMAAEAAHQAARLGAGARAGALAGALLSACTDAATVALEGCEPVELSPRRRDAAVLAMEGLDGRSIAARLGVSVRTVENHLARVYRQVGVVGRQELSELFTAGVAPFAATTR